MSDMAALVANNLDIWTGAVEHKSSSGRGSSKKIDLYGIDRLRSLILDLAVRGKLVSQRADDEPAAQVLKRAKVQRATLQEEGVVGRARKVKAPSNSKPFVIPIGWEWTQLAHIGHDWGQETPESQFTYVDVGAIDQRRGIIENPKILDASDAPSRARKIVRKGTVIYSTVRPYLMNIAVVGEEFEPTPIASTAFAVIHPFSGVEARFLYYYLRSSIFVTYVESVQSGIAYPAINDKQFYSAWFPLPPLAEQKRIVAKVDELMALCDALAQESEDALAAHQTLVETLLATLVNSTDAADLAKNWARLEEHFHTLFITEASIDALKQAILDLAVRGRLVEHENDGASAQDVCLEVQRLMRAKGITQSKPFQKIDPEELPFGLPSSWRWVRLGKFVKLWNGFAFKSRDFGPEGVPVVRIGDLQDGVVDTSKAMCVSEEIASVSKKQFWIPENALLIAMSGATTGKTAFNKSGRKLLLNQRVGMIEVFVGEPQYVKFFFDTIVAHNLSISAGSAIPNLSAAQINNTCFPLPPIAEQKRIVAKVDELMALCNALKSRISDAAETQRHLTDAIVERAAG